jgi:hypothetical protein
MSRKHLTRAERRPLSALADFIQLATMSDSTVCDFIGGIVDEVARGLSTEELLRLKSMAGRLERACDCALESRTACCRN